MEEKKKSSDTVKNIIIVILSICVLVLGGLLIYNKLYGKNDSNTNLSNNLVENTNTTNINDNNNNSKVLCFKENVPAYTKLTADLFEECNNYEYESLDSTFDFNNNNYYTFINANKDDTMKYSDVYWDIENYKPGSVVKIFDGEITFNINSNNIEVKNPKANKSYIIFDNDEVKFASVYVAEAAPAVSVLIAGKNGGTYYVTMIFDADINGETWIANIKFGEFGTKNPIKFCAYNLTDYSGGIPSIFTKDEGLNIIMDFD